MVFLAVGTSVSLLSNAFIDPKFCRNLPLGGLVFVLIALFLTLTGVDESTRKIPLKIKLWKLDLPGAVLLVAAVSCLFLALQEGGVKVPWSSSKPIGLLVGFGLLMFVFAGWQWRAGENAMVPVHYLGDRTVLWGSLYLFLDNMASYLVSANSGLYEMDSALTCVQTIYYMPFYFQAALNRSPLRSGVDYMSLAVPQMIGLLAGGGITTATGHYVRVPHTNRTDHS